MNKIVSIALLVAGLILIGYGVQASESIGSAFSRLFTGTPTDKTVWLIIAGAVATLVGAISLFRGTTPVRA
jgi:hypothetical protein